MYIKAPKTFAVCLLTLSNPVTLAHNFERLKISTLNSSVRGILYSIQKSLWNSLRKDDKIKTNRSIQYIHTLHTLEKRRQKKLNAISQANALKDTIPGQCRSYRTYCNSFPPPYKKWTLIAGWASTTLTSSFSAGLPVSFDTQPSLQEQSSKGEVLLLGNLHP